MGMNFRIIKVHANKYNHTGIQIEAGDTVLVESDQSDRWKDLFVECDSTGWNSHLAMLPIIKKCKDLPEENLMLMCAKIGTRLYPIGKNNTIVAEERGELIFFANDLKYLRWNNSCSIDVTVRIK